MSHAEKRESVHMVKTFMVKEELHVGDSDISWGRRRGRWRLVADKFLVPARRNLKEKQKRVTV